MSEKLSVERIDQVTDSQALFADIINRHSPFQAMTGKMPQEATAEMILKGEHTVQTDSGMPIVRALDSLPKKTGSLNITMDVYTNPKVKPRMNNAYAEGYEAGAEFDQINFDLGLARFPYDTGTKLDQQAVKYDISNLAEAAALSSPERWAQQLLTMCLFSGRGIENHDGWTVPLASEDDYGDVCVNHIKAPARANHFRWNQTTEKLEKVTESGGELVMATTDVLSTQLLDALTKQLAAMPWSPSPVQFAREKSGRTKPTYLMLIPQIAMSEISTRDDYRTLISAIGNRVTNVGNHSIFDYAEAKWGNILIMTVPWNVFWNSEASVPYCSSAESQEETSAVVPAAFAASEFVMTRAIILGSSAVAQGFGTLVDTGSPVDIQKVEKDYNFRSGLASSILAGHDKIQYQRKWQDGQKFWCDRGIVTVDFAMKLGETTFNPFK